MWGGGGSLAYFASFCLVFLARLLTFPPLRPGCFQLWEVPTSHSFLFLSPHSFLHVVANRITECASCDKCLCVLEVVVANTVQWELNRRQGVSCVWGGVGTSGRFSTGESGTDQTLGCIPRSGLQKDLYDSSR